MSVCCLQSLKAIDWIVQFRHMSPLLLRMSYVMLFELFRALESAPVSQSFSSIYSQHRLLTRAREVKADSDVFHEWNEFSEESRRCARCVVSLL